MHFRTHDYVGGAKNREEGARRNKTVSVTRKKLSCAKRILKNKNKVRRWTLPDFRT